MTFAHKPRSAKGAAGRFRQTSRTPWRSRLLGVTALALACAQAAERTALDRYIAAPDPSYRYELVRALPEQGVTVYVLELTSQTWRSPQEVDRTVWKHWLTVFKPDRPASPIGLLFITGGSNRGGPPARPDAMLRGIARDTGGVVAELRMVPNQPLTFAGETQGRVEDALIAYTWDKFMRTGDETWPARLPMTKAAVRAMDAVTSFCAGTEGGGVKVDRFVVAGGSKRGWTTWTTAAVDRRVAAIAPLVIDVLNLEKSMIHHYRAYGFWAPAIKDYQDMRIMDWMGRPEFRALMKIEEPFEYRARFTMPKFMINSSGDQFFLPDSSQFYFDELPGEKHLRYVPNTDHSLRNSDAVQSLVAFHDSVLRGTARPRYSWKFEKDGSIRIKTADQPAEVKLWQATNPKARDFRLETLGPVWKSQPLREQGRGVYVGHVAPPPQGWTAFFVELTYPSGAKHPFKFTSGVRVVPDRLPHPAPKPSS